MDNLGNTLIIIAAIVLAFIFYKQYNAKVEEEARQKELAKQLNITAADVKNKNTKTVAAKVMMTGLTNTPGIGAVPFSWLNKFL